MTTEHSTYTYEGGEQETVTLLRGRFTPRGHALLKINYSDGEVADCYVNTAWLRDRANDLEPRPLTPDAITDEMVERGVEKFRSLPTAMSAHARVSIILTAALTEPPKRPEGAEDIEALLIAAWREGLSEMPKELADFLAAHLTDPTRKEA